MLLMVEIKIQADFRLSEKRNMGENIKVARALLLLSKVNMSSLNQNPLLVLEISNFIDGEDLPSA